MTEELRFHRENDCLWVVPLNSHQDFCLSPQLDDLRAELDRCALPRVIVDLSGLPAFGSTLLDLLVVIWRKIGRRDGRLVLYKPSQIGREVLSAAKLNQLWPMAETREVAMELARTADVD